MNLTAHETVVLLADAVLKSALLLALTGCISKLLWRSSAAIRHLLWTSALLALPVIFFASLTLPGLEILPAWSGWQPHLEPTAVVSSSQIINHKSSIINSDPALAPPSPHVNVVAEQLPQPQSHGLSGWQWVAIIYAVGVAAACLPIILGWLSVSWLARRADRLCSQTMTSQLHQAKSMLHLRRNVTLMHSDLRPVPMTWGILRPKVLLPSDAWQWSADRRLAVLLHELAHVKRLDCLTKTLAQAVCAMVWFNPLVWLAARRMNVECEHAADDMVLTAGQSGRNYAQHLLDIASNLQSNMLAVHHAIAMARPSTLEHRLLSVLDAKRNRRAVSSALAVIALVIAATVAVPVAMLQAQSDQPAASSVVQEAVNAISTCVETDPRIKTAMDSLKPFDKQQVVEALTRHLDDAEVTRRRAAIYILWNGDFNNIDSAVPQLMQLTNNPEEFTAGMSALALGQKKVAASYDRLADMTLHAQSGYVRRCAAISLGWMGDPRAIDVLNQALNDKDPLVVANAQAALKLLQNPPADQQSLQVAPKVVNMLPANGDQQVDPGTQTLRIRFDRPMTDDSWSIVGGGPFFPEITGKPSYDKDFLELSLPVRLKPGWNYELWLNRNQFQNFTSREGVPLESVHVTFKTTGEALEQLPPAPKVLDMLPVNGNQQVDPNLQMIRIRFDQPMTDGSWSLVGGGPNFPQVTGQPSYDKDFRVLSIPVKLQPDHNYELWLNSENFRNFVSRQGVPLEPVHVTFKTGPGN